MYYGYITIIRLHHDYIYREREKERDMMRNVLVEIVSVKKSRIIHIYSQQKQELRQYKEKILESVSNKMIKNSSNFQYNSGITKWNRK